MTSNDTVKKEEKNVNILEHPLKYAHSGCFVYSIINKIFDFNIC